MYRDSSHRPADHDRAVGAIQIADGLLADCAAASARLCDSERLERLDRWAALRTLHDGYPELWNQLDMARRILASRGANTTGYDELRDGVRPLAIASVDGSRPIEPALFPPLLDDARCAIEELRLAIPGADWQELEARGQKLAATRLGRRGRFVFAALVSGFVLAFSVWGTSMMPKLRTSAAAQMRVELAEVVVERRARIDELHGAIGQTCDRPRVLELMRLFVMDGRFDDAKTYADRYETQCGEDMAVRKWANAPKPKPLD
jgi:hypothetical protein